MIDSFFTKRFKANHEEPSASFACQKYDFFIASILISFYCLHLVIS